MQDKEGNISFSLKKETQLWGCNSYFSVVIKHQDQSNQGRKNLFWPIVPEGQESVMEE